MSGGRVLHLRPLTEAQRVSVGVEPSESAKLVDAILTLADLASQVDRPRAQAAVDEIVQRLRLWVDGGSQ